MNINSSGNPSDLPGFFSIPTVIKKIFDRVPVVVYPPNQLPQSSSKPNDFPSLHVFSREEDATRGNPSFNPSCLKWQTFLKMVGIEHILIPSNNHASPTGSLPFLLPALNGSNSSSGDSSPIAVDKISRFAKEHGAIDLEISNIRYEAYQSLLDHRIRNAWVSKISEDPIIIELILVDQLHFLYIESQNFYKVAYPFYVAPVSSNLVVRAITSYQLQAAAEAELLKYSLVIDMDDLYSEADKAFEALSMLLGENEWFFGNENPALFDASVFAYSQLLLDDKMGWQETKLCKALQEKENLVKHRERILQRFYDRS